MKHANALVDLGFSPEFRCALVERSPIGRDPDYHFGGDPDSGPWDHFEIELGHQRWIGAVEYGDHGHSGIYATPSPEHLLIVRRGTAYFIPVRTPQAWHAPPVLPVLGVQRVEGEPIILLWDFRELVAYGRHGLIWRHDRLGLDDLAIASATQQAIVGSCFGLDNGCDSSATFLLNPNNGKHLPGSRYFGSIAPEPLTGRVALKRGGSRAERFGSNWPTGPPN